MGCRVPCWQVAPAHSAQAVGWLVSGHPPSDHAADCLVHPPVQVASLKLELAALKSEQDIREDELLGQIASLQVGAAPASPIAGICCEETSAPGWQGMGFQPLFLQGLPTPGCECLHVFASAASLPITHCPGATQLAHLCPPASPPLRSAGPAGQEEEEAVARAHAAQGGRGHPPRTGRHRRPPLSQRSLLGSALPRAAAC